MSREPVEIRYYKIVRETDLATQYDLSDNPFEPDRHWLPKSQVVDDDGTNIIIPEWLAIQEGLV